MSPTSISFRAIMRSNTAIRIFCTTFALILVIGVFSIVPFSQHDEIYNGNLMYGSSFTTPLITSTTTINQSFVISANQFTDLDLFFATLARTNTATLDMELFRGEELIAITNLSTSRLIDNSFYSWEIPLQANSAGQSYTLRITSPDGTETNAVVMRYGSTAMANATLRINEGVVDGTLFLVPRYKISSFEYVRKLAERINLNKGGFAPPFLTYIVLASIAWIVLFLLVEFVEQILELFAGRPHIAQMMRYLIVGGSAATIELITFLLLFYNGVWYLWANITAFALATSYGFFLQKLWTFQNRHKAYHVQAAKFLIITGIGFLLNNFFIFLFVDVWALQPFIAKFVQLWLVLIWNYSGQKWWAFKHHDKI